MSGFAGGEAGHWAANSSMLVNGISSPVLRSAVVSPLAAGTGHITGGTTAGLIQGQSFDEAFANSFNGLGQGMALGAAIGVASTVGVSYANKISPWTGKSIAANTRSKILLNTSKKLQAKFKHAGDFGVEGNYSKANAGKYSSAINQHINSADVLTINGTYRGQPVTHYVNPNTGLNVIVQPSGQFISGWKLNPCTVTKCS